MDASNYEDVFSSTTNWRIAGGGLTDSISYESSSSPSDGIIPSAVDHVAKSPLLLLPPFPNGEPCEITITFTQEHELRQVYIRSTARVYEVYYTQKRGNDREYLCTVRCGIAAREEDEEELLQIPRTDSPSMTQVEPVKDPIERRVKDNGSGRANEGDWVEVKAGDDSLLNNEKYLLQIPQLGNQDFFEATAEINDAEPCISITLRLLSLQDKGCALVDEIYLFADPIDQSELERDEASGAANSSSISLMAMFMPTLLQLSLGKDVRKERDGQVSDKSYSTMIPGNLGNSNGSGKIANEIQQEIKSCKTDHKGVSSPVVVDTLARHVDATRVSLAEINPDTSCNNVETILDQLVNKVSRIETILTRFENQMLRPINSIDARLQLVEKKLEQLGKKSLESVLFVETEISNPDSLGSDTDKTPETSELDGLTKNTDNPQLASSSLTVVPDSSRIDNSEDYAVVLPNKLDNIFTKFIEQGSENNSTSGNEVISAESEISSEEVGQSFGRGAAEKNPKHLLSINDALASALAGLLSSTSVTDGKHRQAFVITAPEFSNGDDMEMEKKPLTGTHPDESQVTAEEFKDRQSVLDSPICSREELKITLFAEDNSQEMGNGVSEKLRDSLGGYDEAKTVTSVRKDDLDKEAVTSSTKTDCYIERENLSYEPGNPDCLVHELENPNVITGCGSSRLINEGEPGVDDDLKSVLGFQPTTCSVDFQTPILDVKFNPEKKVSENKCFFESLLTAESKTVVDCNKDAFDDNLVSVDDEELNGPPIDTLSSVEIVHYEPNEMMHLQLNADISTASLI